MTTITLNQIQPGMVLSEDVIHNGRVLLHGGSELTEQHTKIFKTWGILNVSIQSPDAEIAGSNQPLSPDTIKFIEHTQRLLFQHADLNHPFMAELFRLSVKNELNRLAGNI